MAAANLLEKKSYYAKDAAVRHSLTQDGAHKVYTVDSVNHWETRILMIIIDAAD
jgi:hypothetical protein